MSERSLSLETETSTHGMFMALGTLEGFEDLWDACDVREAISGLYI